MRRVCLRGLTFPAVCAVTALCGCGGGKKGGEDADRSPGAATREADAQLVSNTPWPSDPCAWVTAAEVASAIGPLAGPPRAHEGDCLFPLEPPPPDAETLRRQEVGRKLEELARKMGSTMPPDRRPTEPAVMVSVQMRRSVDEQAISAAENIMASWAGLEADSSRPAQKWDVARSPITIGLPGFFGRSGELSIMVQMQAISLPKETVAALAPCAGSRPSARSPLPGPARRAAFGQSRPAGPRSLQPVDPGRGGGRARAAARAAVSHSTGLAIRGSGRRHLRLLHRGPPRPGYDPAVGVWREHAGRGAPWAAGWSLKQSAVATPRRRIPSRVLGLRRPRCRSRGATPS